MPQPDGRNEPRAGFGLAPRLLLFGVLLWLGNETGAIFRYPEIGSALFFVPYAVLTTALLFSPPRQWVWYFAIGFVTHAVASWPTWTWSWVLLADAANIARAFVAAYLLRRLFNGPPQLTGVPAVMMFVGIACVVAPAVGATIGAATVVVHGGSPTYWQPWLSWFTSNALTGLIMMPGLIAAMRVLGGPLPRVQRRRVAEALLLAAGFMLTCALIFLQPFGGRWLREVSFYAPLPVLVWAALRFGPGGASVVVTAIITTAIWAADRALGPFRSPAIDDTILVLQLFAVLSTLPVLCLAAVGSGRRQAVRLYRTLLASLQDQVAIIDAGGTVMEVSDSWRRFAATGRIRRADRVVEGHNYLEALRTDAGRGHEWAVTAFDGVTAVLNRSRRRYDMEYEEDVNGRHEWFTFSAEFFERPEGGAVITRSCITTSRQAQLELDAQRGELSHLARVAVLGQLSGAFAHELRQPLSSILANAETGRLLAARDPIDRREVAAILQDIIDEDRRAGQVIERLRDLLKSGDSRMQTIDAAELVHEVLDLSRAELITRRVTAGVHIEPCLPVVSGDRVQLQQVLLNLILNACDAMTGTGPAERVVLLQVMRLGDDHLDISVRDNGSGIPQDLIDRLFEPFVTTKTQGLGLGLSIVRSIVAAHGGRVWAENNPEGGATIHCAFRVSGASAAVPPRDATASKATLPPPALS